MDNEEDSLHKTAQSSGSDTYDITLQTGEGEIPCHRFILMTYSDFFDDILQGTNQSCNFLALEESGIPHQILQILIDFMYTSEMDLSPDLVEKVLEAAENLKIPKAVAYINDHYVCEDGSVSDVKLEARKPAGRKKAGRKIKAEPDSPEGNPYKEELDLASLDQEQIEAVMRSDSGRSRRKSSMRLAAVMRSVKTDDADDVTEFTPMRNKELKTYGRSSAKPETDNGMGEDRAQHQNVALHMTCSGDEATRHEDQCTAGDHGISCARTVCEVSDEVSNSSAAGGDVAAGEANQLAAAKYNRTADERDAVSEEAAVANDDRSSEKAGYVETHIEISEAAKETEKLFEITDLPYKDISPGDNKMAVSDVINQSTVGKDSGMNKMAASDVINQSTVGKDSRVKQKSEDRDWTPKRKNTEDSSEAKKKKRYKIPENTLNFLKQKKLLYKVQPGEGQETIEELRQETKAIKNDAANGSGNGGTTKRTYRTVGLLKKYTDPNTPGWYVCPWENCTFKSRHSKNVYVHEKGHTGERPWACDQCTKTFISKKHLTVHMNIHSDVRPYMCDICLKCFRTQNSLDRHMLCHTGEKPFKCEQEGCQQAFKDKINLRKHVSLVHLGERPFECDHPSCGYVSYDKHGLARHQLRHLHLSDRKSEECQVCGKVLFGARSLQSHMLTHQGKPNQCPYCPYTSVFRQALLAHSYRKHNMDLEGNQAERKYRCDKCDFATFWYHDLKFHLIKHTGVRPFRCPICDYSTVLKGSLVKHMRLHTGEQPFKCDLCSKAYTNQSGLARHKRTHTGEKPHKCEICGKKYADLKTMRTHRYAHLNVKPYMCHLCNYTCTKKEVLVTHFRKVHGDGCVPPDLRPKPMNKVLMRVTSGQTADEIVRNIVPTGQGERQYLFFNAGVTSEHNKFLVIHEDDLLLHNAADSFEQKIDETAEAFIEDGVQMELDGDEHRAEFQTKDVMKIATAARPQQPQKSTLQYHTVPEFLNTLKTQYTSIPQYDKPETTVGLTTAADAVQLTSVPAGLVMLSSLEGQSVKEVEFKSDVTSPENAQNALRALTQALVTSEGWDESTVKALQEGTFVIQQASGDSHVGESQSSSGVQLTHPILQAQLTGKEVLCQTNLINAFMKQEANEHELPITSSKFTLKKTADFPKLGVNLNFDSKDLESSAESLVVGNTSGKVDDSHLNTFEENRTVKIENSLTNNGLSVENSIEKLGGILQNNENSTENTDTSMDIQSIAAPGDNILTPEQIRLLTNQISASHEGQEIVLEMPEGSLNTTMAQNLQIGELNGDYMIAYVDQGEAVSGENG